MNAMIFAAGVGSRLLPLTENKPKALVEFKGKPLLRIQIEKLSAAGFDKIVINVHHFSEQIKKFIAANRFDAEIIISDESDLLLDTGGGLKYAAKYFDGSEPFLIHNVDILTDIDLRAMTDYHKSHLGIATLAVRRRKSMRYLLFDDELNLCGRINKKNGESIIVGNTAIKRELAFSGIHIVSPEIFNFFPEQKVFSILDVYLSAAEKFKVKGFLHNESKWLDVGAPEKLILAEKLFG